MVEAAVHRPTSTVLLGYWWVSPATTSVFFASKWATPELCLLSLFLLGSSHSSNFQYGNMHRHLYGMTCTSRDCWWDAPAFRGQQRALARAWGVLLAWSSQGVVVQGRGVPEESGQLFQQVRLPSPLFPSAFLL